MIIIKNGAFAALLYGFCAAWVWHFVAHCLKSSLTHPNISALLGASFDLAINSRSAN